MPSCGERPSRGKRETYDPQGERRTSCLALLWQVNSRSVSRVVAVIAGSSGTDSGPTYDNAACC